MKCMRTALGFLMIAFSLTTLAEQGARLIDSRPQAEEPAKNEGLENLEEGSATEELSRQFHLSEPGLSGIITDRTITMLGREFYRQFTQKSNESPIISETNLSVHERPDARWGSQVWIAQNNRIIFQATLPPRISDIEGYAEAAFDQVQQRLIQETIMRAIGNDPDLADEEI